MDWFIVIALLALGWLFLFLEIFFIPGVTVLAILGVVLMLAGITLSFGYFGAEAGWYTLGATSAVVVATSVLAFRSRFWKGLSLNDTLRESRMNTIDGQKVQPGSRARAVSRIAPSGKAMIAGDVYEVHSEEGFIDQESELEVVKIMLNKIIVRKANL